MDHSAELRYYEILFIKTVHQFHQHFEVAKLKDFMEMAAFVSDANITLVLDALQEVLVNGPVNYIIRDEYIVCLKLFSGLNDTQIRGIMKCGPNTIKHAMEDYENEDLFIQNKLELRQSNEVRKLMKSLRGIGQIY